MPVMEKAIKERFKGQYPARKPIQTDRGTPLREEFFQLDAIAYRG
jgi:hypothetical protein